MSKFAVLDGYSLLYRAFHGLAVMMNAPDGTPTNAIHGFLMMLMKVVDEEKPDGLAVAFDLHAPTFRHKFYDGYKATRKPMPDELRAQVPVLRELLTRMGIPILECEGYEADDILGTVSMRCEETGEDALLVTGDRDSFQLSGPKTTILYTKKGISETVAVTPAYIRETYGVEPKQMIEVKSLMGDTSDNIPGIAGIGEKTALNLIKKYGDLEQTLTRGPVEEKGKLRERLETGAEQARMSRVLAEIDRKAPLEYDWSEWKLDSLSGGMARLRELGMNMCLKRLRELCARLGTAEPKCAEPVCDEEQLPEAVTAADLSELMTLCMTVSDTSWVAVHFGAEFSLAMPQLCVKLPLGGDLLTPGIDEGEALNAVRPLLERAGTLELWNVKRFPMEEAELSKAFDVMLAAYVLNPQRGSFEAKALCEAEDVQGYDACPAAAVHRLAVRERAMLEKLQMTKIYEELELPLAFVLCDMEREGFLLNADALRVLGEDFDARIDSLVAELDEMMGEKINLNSTKQLGEMLFVKMGLPAPKKNSRGFSTDAEVLETLAADYPVCAKILEYRKYKKLRSTYIDSLIALRDENGRVHTHFEQTGTATGRLSSAEPNLQNIPVRTDIGKEIRAAFVASPGCVLVDADYSQVELRVLAHISGDATMIDAFCSGQDIHARTASEVYGVPLSEVTHSMRSSCKAVNFGIVYGISDFQLAKNIGVSRREAKAFIDRYLERYPGVKRYMEESVRTAHEKGYAQTLMGRRRYLPELASPNFNVRSFGERCAMNSPIQGTAADIIKLAMLSVARELKKYGMKTKLLLQVHDELILEAPENEAEEAKALLQRCMESVFKMEVPLKTEITEGSDWRACK